MKNPLVSIFLVVFLDLLGFGMVIPILPYYATEYGASPLMLGLLMSCYSAMQLVFSPFWGRLSDRIWRRPVILTCIAGLGLAMLMLGLAKSLAWLFVARLLGGFFGANISAATAYIADVTTPEKRARGMGMIGAAFGLGFLFGPAFGGLLSKWGYGFPSLVAAGLSLINLFMAYRILKEPEITAEERAKHRPHLEGSFILTVLKNPQTALAIGLFFLVTFGIAQLETSFALLLLSRFGLDAMHAGFILASLALVMALIQGGAIGKLAKAFGEIKLMRVGTFLMAAGIIGAALSPGLSVFVAFLMLQSLGYSVTNPSLYSMVSRHAGPGTQGGTMGVYQSAGSLGRILGPLLAGYLFQSHGEGCPFIVAGVLFAVCWALLLARAQVWSVAKI